MTTPNRTARRATWTILPLSLALVGALAFSPAFAQDAAAGGRRGAIGERFDAVARRVHERTEGERGGRREGAFARWLAADAEAGPVVPGLVGRVAAGTTVRLVFYDGAPEEGGTELGTLTFVAGADDAAAFRETVRTTAEGATHVVVDVLGRVVSLPEAAAADATE